MTAPIISYVNFCQNCKKGSSESFFSIIMYDDMDIFKTFKKENKRWVIGVSGGADSMSLLDMCRSNGIFVVAAHVNYRKRSTADRDMNGVQRYCERFSIPFACKIVDEYPKSCNFQDYARQLRYAYYREICDMYQCEGVMVAHQLDDHLETYLLQKKRGAHIRYAGIQPEITLYGLRVVRPLLGYTKQELQEYCHRHHVHYYDDESNFTDHYARNQIRHQVIDKLTYDEKQRMVNEIAAFNEHGKQREERNIALHEEFIQECTSDFLHRLSEGTCLNVLRSFLEMHDIYKVSEPQLRNIRQMLLQKEGNHACRVGNYTLRCEYGMISLTQQSCLGYSYIVHSPAILTTPYFRTVKTGTVIDGVTVSESDFPLTIRNARPGDAISLRFGKKRLNRWFIDRKIPASQREIWPVVENKNGKIIFVVGIGCDIEHFSNNPNLFVLK